MADAKRDLEPFLIVQGANMAQRWKDWLIDFKVYLISANITGTNQKRGKLLHLAGPDVRKIYAQMLGDAALEPEYVSARMIGEGDAARPMDSYLEAVQVLTSHFASQSNETYERHQLRAMKPFNGETVDAYFSRLHQQASFCGYSGDETDKAVRDQFMESWPWPDLKRELFLETIKSETTLTLKKTKELAKLHEALRTQLNLSGDAAQEEAIVNKVEFRQQRQRYNQPGNSGVRCYRCGNKGHLRSDQNCPAWGKTCFKCGQKNHMAEVCKSSGQRGQNHGKGIKQGKTGKSKAYIANDSNSSDLDDNIDPVNRDSDYNFHICALSVGNLSLYPVIIGGVCLKVLIDSGSNCNLVDRVDWELLKSHHVSVSSSVPAKESVKGVGSSRQGVIGSFTTYISAPDGPSVPGVEFKVLKERNVPILGKVSATELGLLRVGPVCTSNTVNAFSDLEARVKQEFSGLFKGLGKLKNFQLKIPINREVRPVIQSARRIPFNLRTVIEEELDKLLKLDVIEKVDGFSEWVSPVHLVPKSNGNWRMTIDMRQANKAVLRERFQIPTIEEALLKLNGAKVFSKLDVKLAFHQIELHPDSRGITTFITHHGLYQYKRLMFGISCAPEMFQKCMMQAFQDLPGVTVHFDDFLVWGINQAEHDKNLWGVLHRLKVLGLTLNEKCAFGLFKVGFLGHVISGEGYHPDPSKLVTIADFRAPANLTELKSFLGLLTFCSKFIHDFSNITAPLRALCKMSNSGLYVWGPDQQKAFSELKKQMASPPTLAYYDKDAPTQVIADASPYGIGCVLTQLQEGEYRIVQYASRALSDVESRYSHTEKEALALVWACERFQMYLYGKRFELITDHKPLETIFGSGARSCARVERWALRLQCFTFDVKYKAGKTNIADPFSRLLDASKKPSDDFEPLCFSTQVVQSLVPSAMTLSEVRQATLADNELQELIHSLCTNRWQKHQRLYQVIEPELSVLDGIVLRGTRLVLPKPLHIRALVLAHEGHMSVDPMKRTLRTKVWWKGIDSDAEGFVKSCHDCQITQAPGPPEPMIRTELPSRGWQYLAADFLGPLPSGCYILVIVDYYSRFIEIKITKSTTAAVVKDFLVSLFRRYLLPETIVTDNGPCFNSQEFQTFLKSRNIQHKFTTALWPQANGEVERQNRSILKRLKIAHAAGRDWKSELSTYLTAYHATPHSVTGKPPAELFLGRPIRTLFPEVKQEYIGVRHDESVRDRDAVRKLAGKLYSDAKRHAVPSEIEVGQQVLIREEKSNKLSTPFNPQPVTVIRKNGSSIAVQTPNGITIERNSSFFRPYVSRDKTDVDTSDLKSPGVPSPSPSVISPQPVTDSMVTNKPERDEFVINMTPMRDTGCKSVDQSCVETPIRRVSRRHRNKPPFLNDYVLHKQKTL